jgi:hypothetical protein
LIVVEQTNGAIAAEAPSPVREAPHDARGYFIAPDSGEPWPDAVWEQVDPKTVERAAKRVAERGARVSAEAKREFATPRGFLIQKRDREFLRAVGGPASKKALDRLAK